MFYNNIPTKSFQPLTDMCTQLEKIVNKNLLLNAINYSQPAITCSNRNTRTRCEVCSNLTIKKPGQRRRSGVFIANFEHISYLVL